MIINSKLQKYKYNIQQHNIQVDLLKRRQQHEAFFKCFKDHLLELQFPSDEELKAAKEGGGQLGSKLMKLAQNRDLHHTEMSDTYGLENDQNRDRYKKKNYLNLFQVERGPCRICSNKEVKCPFYRACFNIETFRGIELFSCLNCGCPMNSHVILQSDYNFSNSICSQVNRRYINESHLQFKACISIFFVDINTAKDFKIDIEGFITSLNEAGFNALSFYEMDISTLQKIWLEKSLYSKKSHIKVQEFQQYYHFFGTFLEMISKFGVNDKFALQDCLQNPDDIRILEFYLNRLEKVNQKLGLAYQRNKVAFIFLISGIILFKKYISFFSSTYFQIYFYLLIFIIKFCLQKLISVFLFFLFQLLFLSKVYIFDLLHSSFLSSEQNLFKKREFPIPPIIFTLRLSIILSELLINLQTLFSLLYTQQFQFQKSDNFFQDQEKFVQHKASNLIKRFSSYNNLNYLLIRIQNCLSLNFQIIYLRKIKFFQLFLFYKILAQLFLILST